MGKAVGGVGYLHRSRNHGDPRGRPRGRSRLAGRHSGWRRSRRGGRRSRWRSCRIAKLGDGVPEHDANLYARCAARRSVGGSQPGSRMPARRKCRKFYNGRNTSISTRGVASTATRDGQHLTPTPPHIPRSRWYEKARPLHRTVNPPLNRGQPYWLPPLECLPHSPPTLISPHSSSQHIVGKKPTCGLSRMHHLPSWRLALWGSPVARPITW